MYAVDESNIHQAVGLIKSTEIGNSQYGQVPNTAYTIRRNGTAYYRQDGATNTVSQTIGGRDAINTYHFVADLDTGDVWIGLTPAGSSLRWIRSSNAMASAWASHLPTFSGLDLSVYDTFYFQQYYTTQSAWVNFIGNPLFDGQLSSGNDSSDWFKDPDASLSASSFTSGTAETRTLPQLSWGGITGRSVLTEEVPSYEIDHSLDFDGSNDYLSWSSPSASDRRTNTVSLWFKTHATNVTHPLFQQRTASTTLDPQFIIQLREISGENYLRILDQNSGNQILLDSNSDLTFSANTWYHLVVSVDTTQATDTDRVKVWVDGERYTNWSSPLWPTLNYDTGINRSSTRMLLGVQRPNASTTLDKYTNGHIAEFHFVDGQALDVTAFGQTVSGTWHPKAYSGAYGTNGFYLDFADNSNTAALGNDVSGNSNNFTVNNMATDDQTTDVPAAAPTSGTQSLVNTGIFTLEEIYELTKSPIAVWNGLGAEFLLVGGGGSGGGGQNAAPGGGGAGGMVVGVNQTLSINTTYSIVIGSGGAGGGGSEADGADSTFSFNTLVATGGGRGGRFTDYKNVEVGKDGGAGGGGGCVFRTASPAGPRAGGTSTQNAYSGGITGYGFDGGTGNQYPPSGTVGYYAAGGGGAGAVGSTSAPSSGYAGDGGAGRQWAVDSQYYAGGGGGSGLREGGPATTGGAGGIGGGGVGQRYDGGITRSETAGTANTGGGGGGYASGGSGVFKIWVPVANYTDYVVGAELTEAASQQVTYGGTDGTLITITASSGTSTNTITFN
jgi:hypothetical protein